MHEFDFVAYMEYIARKLKEVAHNGTTRKTFHKVSGIAQLEEFLGNTTVLSPTIPQILVEENLIGQFSDLKSNNVMDTEFYAFYVVVHAKANDYAAIAAAKKTAKGIQNKILSKLRYDYIQENQGKIDVGLRNFRTESVSYRSMGPIGDNFFGTYCSFTIEDFSRINYSANDWNS